MTYLYDSILLIPSKSSRLLRLLHFDIGVFNPNILFLNGYLFGAIELLLLPGVKTVIEMLLLGLSCHFQSLNNNICKTRQ